MQYGSAADSDNVRLIWWERGALILIVGVFGIAGLFDSQAQGWLRPPRENKGSIAVAGAVTEATAVPSEVLAAPREPEQVMLPLAHFADAVAAVQAAGTTVGEKDYVTAWPDPAWGWGGTAWVYRAQAVEIRDANQKSLYFTWKATAEELLAEQGIELGEQDRIDVPPTSPIQTPTAAVPVVITITRVQETTVVVWESIPVETTYQDDPTKEKGTERVLESGQSGAKAHYYRVRRENGVEVRRSLEKTVTEKPMTKKVVSRGTKVLVYGSGQATWYASRRGMAASHNTLAPGTRVRVVNTQSGKSVVVTVEGGGVHGATIDLGKDAFSALGSLGKGRLPVRLEKVYD